MRIKTLKPTSRAWPPRIIKKCRRSRNYSDRPLYKGQAKRTIFTPLDKLVPDATAALLEFKKRCDADPSRFEGAFFQGLTHGDLNWKNILKDQSDKIWIIGTSGGVCARLCMCCVGVGVWG